MRKLAKNIFMLVNFPTSVGGSINQMFLHSCVHQWTRKKTNSLIIFFIICLLALKTSECRQNNNILNAYILKVEEKSQVFRATWRMESNHQLKTVFLHHHLTKGPLQFPPEKTEIELPNGSTAIKRYSRAERIYIHEQMFANTRFFHSYEIDGHHTPDLPTPFAVITVGTLLRRLSRDLSVRAPCRHLRFLHIRLTGVYLLTT